MNKGEVSWRDVPDKALIQAMRLGVSYPAFLAEFDRRFGPAPVYFYGPPWLRLLLRLWPFKLLWKQGGLE